MVEKDALYRLWLRGCSRRRWFNWHTLAGGLDLQSLEGKAWICLITFIDNLAVWRIAEFEHAARSCGRL